MSTEGPLPLHLVIEPHRYHPSYNQRVLFLVTAPLEMHWSFDG